MKKIFLYLSLIIIVLTGCNSDDTTARPDVPGKVAMRIDSISDILDGESLFHFDYDAQHRVKECRKTWGTTVPEKSDTISFHYDRGRIVLHMILYRRLMSMAPVARFTPYCIFYTKDGKIVSGSMPFDISHDRLRDSIAYSYTDNKLTGYEVYITLDGNVMGTKYVQRLNWQGDDLKDMLATQDGEKYFETVFHYNDHLLTALLPFMSFDYLMDHDRTYISVLANMGYFGTLPKHELTGLTMASNNKKYELQIDYHYGATPLPEAFDYEYKYSAANVLDVQSDWLVVESEKVLNLPLVWVINQ